MDYMCMTCRKQVEILQEAGGYFWLVREFDSETGNELFDDTVISNDRSDPHIEEIIAAGCCGECFEMAKVIAQSIEPFAAPPERQIDIAEVRRLINDSGNQGTPTLKTDFEFKEEWLVDAIARANRSGEEWLAGKDHSLLNYYSKLKVQYGFNEVPFGVIAAAALIATVCSWKVDEVDLHLDEVTIFWKGRQKQPVVGHLLHFEPFFVEVSRYLQKLWLS